MLRRLIGLALVGWLACAAPASAASPFANWAAIIVAGDWRSHTGEPSAVFDNARRDLTTAFVRAGFSPDNILQFSVHEAKPGGPAKSTPANIANGLDTLTHKASGGCLVYFTSHGMPAGVLVDDDIWPPSLMAELVDHTCGKRPTVVVVAACFSGVFVPTVGGPNRMILTAARPDRASFGCGQEDRYTYFDTCILGELPNAHDFAALGRAAQACVARREKALDADPPSEPQMDIGPALRPLLPLYAFDKPHCHFAGAAFASGCGALKAISRVRGFSMRLCVRFALAMAGSAIVALTAGAGGAVPRPYAALEPHPAAHHMAAVRRPAAAVAPKPVVNASVAAVPAAARPIVRPAAPVVHGAEAPPPLAPPTNGARLAPGAPIPPAELEAFVDGAVRQAMTTDHVAGVEVAVVQGGQVVLKKGYGFAGPGRPVDPDNTLFRLGSISKTFTWIAVMKDAEAGRIRLNTPINLYLPESLQVKDQGFKRPILVRDLMTHTSGFADRALGQLFEEDPRRIRPLTLYLRQERPRRVREPGVIASYSNYGAALAGQASSWVNGKPYADLIEGEITGPLGMAHTTFREPYPARAELPAPMPAALAGQAATGYRWAGGVLRPQPFEYVSQIAPAGAASSTAGDMARYMMMILGGGQLDGATIYGPGTAQGFRTTLQSSAPGVNGFDNGFMETALPGGFHGQGHGGDTLWFHSNMVVVPDLNLGVFVTTNTDTGPRLVHSLPGEIVGRFYAPPPPQPPAGSPELANQHSVYDGVYLTARRPYNGLEQFVFLLIGEAQVRVLRDGRMLIARAGEADLWTPAGPPGHFVAADGVQTSAFQIQNGRASRWFDPSGAVTFERIGALRQIPTLVIAALIAAITAIATLVGLFTRDRRESRETPMQARASQVQTATAILFLLAIVLTGLFAVRASDMAYVMYAWPTPYLLIASACALVAAMLSFLTLGMAPTVWRGGRRVESWTSWRKLRFTVTTLVFAGFSVLLALWGALEPWSG